MNKRQPWIIIFCLLFSNVFLFAQSSVSSLRGGVTDASGATVVGAKVLVEKKGTGFSNSRLTDSRGEYQFQHV